MSASTSRSAAAYQEFIRGHRCINCLTDGPSVSVLPASSVSSEFEAFPLCAPCAIFYVNHKRLPDIGARLNFKPDRWFAVSSVKTRNIIRAAQLYLLVEWCEKQA